MNKIIIAGGTGFIGQALETYFQSRGYSVFVLTRTPKKEHHIYWDGRTVGKWIETLAGAQLVINLSGRSVDCRYNRKNKNEIMTSRVASTKAIGEAIKALEHPPANWFNMSTATIYESYEKDGIGHTEKGVLGTDFSPMVAKKWEATFFNSLTPNTRKVALRTSFVLSPSGGALPTMIRMAKRGFASKVGNGAQWISWISKNDFCRSIDFLLHNKTDGVVNITNGHPLRNKTFYYILRSILRPLLVFPQPKWLINLGAVLIGTEPELILKSRKIVPIKLLTMGFDFHDEDLRKLLILP